MSSHAATPAASAVKPVVVVVDTFGGPIRHHNPELPLIYWDDAAVTRGDGVFETLLIRDGHACNLERHSKRFAASAALLGLPEPDAEYWRAATAEAIESWPKDVDASCVWTLTRGRAATNRPSAWITVKQIPVEHLEQRHLGVSVMTAPRGFSVTATPDEAAPWMIVGAKTLSYAANMAALRHARSCGWRLRSGGGHLNGGCCTRHRAVPRPPAAMSCPAPRRPPYTSMLSGRAGTARKPTSLFSSLSTPTRSGWSVPFGLPLGSPASTMFTCPHPRTKTKCDA